MKLKALVQRRIHFRQDRFIFFNPLLTIVGFSRIFSNKLKIEEGEDDSQPYPHR